MALVKSTNSYVTLDEAEVYFEDRLDVAAWNSASDTRKEQALVTATSMLNNMKWAGVAVSESQSLAFPRYVTYFDPMLGYNVTPSTSEVPNRIVNATYELAYHLLNNDGLLDETGSAVKIEVGRVKLDTIRMPHSIPSTVNSLVKPLQVNSGANLWWRAN